MEGSALSFEVYQTEKECKVNIWYIPVAVLAALLMVAAALRLLRGHSTMAVAMCLSSFAFYAMFDPRKVAGTITYWQRWVVLGFFVVVAAIAVLVRRSRQDSHQHYGWFSDPRVWFALFTVWAFIISLFGVDFAESAKRLLGLTAYQALFLWMLPACCAHNPNWRQEVVKGLLWVCWGLVIASYARLLIQPSAAYRFPYFRGVFARGGIATVSITGIACLIALGSRRWWQYTVFGATVFLSGTRAAMVGMVLAIVVLLLKKRLLHKRFVVSALSFVLIAVTLITFLVYTPVSRSPASKTARFVLHRPEDPTTHRIVQWKYSLYVFSRHPMGIGFGVPIPQWYAHKVLYPSRLSFTRSHSMLVGLLVEAGVIGFLLFWIGLFLTLKLAWTRSDSVGAGGLFFMINGLLFIVTASIFPGAGSMFELGMWAFMGLVMSLRRRSIDAPTENSLAAP